METKQGLWLKQEEDSRSRMKVWVFAVVMIAVVIVGAVAYLIPAEKPQLEQAAAVEPVKSGPASLPAVAPLAPKQEVRPTATATPTRSDAEIARMRASYRRELSELLVSAYQFGGDNPVFKWWREKEMTREQLAEFDRQQQKMYGDEFLAALRATFLKRLEDEPFASRATTAMADYSLWQKQRGKQYASTPLLGTATGSTPQQEAAAAAARDEVAKQKFLRANPRMIEYAAAQKAKADEEAAKERARLEYEEWERRRPAGKK